MLARAIALFLVAPAMLHAQERRPSHCIAVAEAPGLEYVHRAAFGAPLPDWTVRLSFVDHAMVMIETPGGLRAVTDYTGFIGQTRAPDVVTMNRAHISHWTPDPDPAIPNVRPGWSDDVGEPADHWLEVGDMVVRSVSTDIRSGAAGGVEENGNAIFVFEVAGLCIGHLGHLHHEPTDAQYAALGRLDVVMAPVDGGLTMDLPTMIRTLGTLRAAVVIPIHWWGRGSLDRFLEGMSGDFAVERPGGNHWEVSLDTLPRAPTIVVLEPAFLSDPE